MAVKLACHPYCYILLVMIYSDKQENKELLEQSVKHLESRGFSNIKADIEGYETPKSYIKKKTSQTITPDITAVKNGIKYLFDISLKSQKPTLLKSKWLLLDTLSRMRSNRFKILTFKGHYHFTRSMLKEINLDNKEPIRIT